MYLYAMSYCNRPIACAPAPGEVAGSARECCPALHRCPTVCFFALGSFRRRCFGTMAHIPSHGELVTIAELQEGSTPPSVRIVGVALGHPPLWFWTFWAWLGFEVRLN